MLNMCTDILVSIPFHLSRRYSPDDKIWVVLTYFFILNRFSVIVTPERSKEIVKMW